MKILLSLLLFIFCSVAWTHPLHLFAGAGANVSTYGPRDGRTIVGGGLNVKADVAYFFTPRWAVEFSSQVKFNVADEFFIWDTLMTVGLRHHFAGTDYYARAFYGRSPTVVYLDDAPEVTRETNSSRLQYDGPVYGVGGGKLFRTQSGVEWFLESTVSYQHLEKETGIRNNGNIPQEVFTSRSRAVYVYSVYAMIGLRIF